MSAVATLWQRGVARSSLLCCVTLTALFGCGEDADTGERAEALVDSAPPVIAADTSAQAPAGVRIRVQVLNATTTTGLARRAAQRLRDLGYDVVDWNSRSEPATATLITVRPPARAWGERLQRALGTGTVTESATLSPYVDALVVLGPDWTPPSQPFRP